MSRERRRLFPVEESEAEPGRYGCPMLSRTRFSLSPDAAPMMRCSFGWALHGEQDVGRCMATDSVLDCWKVHPERTPVVALATANAEAVEAAGD